MSKNKNKNVSPVVVSAPVVVEEAVASLSDVLGEVSETSLETVSETVLSEVLSEEAPTVSLVPDVQETVSVEVPNVFLSKFQNWLTNTTTRAANGGLTSKGKRLGRPSTKTDKVVRLIRTKGETTFRQNGRGRPELFSVTYQISVPKDLVITEKTRFNIDLVTGDWSVVVPPEEIRESIAA